MKGIREKEEGEPPTSVTIACPPEQRTALKKFYKSLVSIDFPCREGGDPYVPPRWPDPEYPQQMHIDLLVADLDACEEIVLANGGRRLQDQGAYRTYADPIAHPLCFYSDTPGRTTAGTGEAPGLFARIVMDCPDPQALATFYERFLRMTETGRGLGRPDRDRRRSSSARRGSGRTATSTSATSMPTRLATPSAYSRQETSRLISRRDCGWDP